MRKTWRSGRFLVLAVCAAITAIGLTVVASVSGRTGPASAAPSGTPGYWLVASDGGVYNLNTPNYGGVRGIRLAQPVVGGAPTSDGRGYWMVASDGGIFTFGDAGFAGSTGGIRLRQPIVGMAADPKTGGYWLVAADGGIFSFNAPFYGSTGRIQLRQPIVGMAVTPDGGGYWLVAADGGIFTFGDAGFYGSTGNVRLHQPIVGMAPTQSGHGYWLVASDGGIFTFGDAGFFGSTGAVRLVAPVKSMQPSPDGQGYWLSATDGGIFTFGDAPYLGSAASSHSPAPIISMLAVDNGFPFPPGTTGYDVWARQCSALPPAGAFAIVQVAGWLNQSPNPCYQQEAAWAGPNMSPYIFMSPMPQAGATGSMNGPAGSCAATDLNCQSYNFGWYWARYWVQYSAGFGVNPNLWWLDVETGPWGTDPGSQATNRRVIDGAVQGLRSMGELVGIYSTAYQWGQITGNQLSYPGMPLWSAGADHVSGDTYSAESICAGTAGPSVAAFAGGKIVLVQYGWFGANGGEYYSTDPDYACVT